MFNTRCKTMLISLVTKTHLYKFVWCALTSYYPMWSETTTQFKSTFTKTTITTFNKTKHWRAERWEKNTMQRNIIFVHHFIMDKQLLLVWFYFAFIIIYWIIDRVCFDVTLYMIGGNLPIVFFPSIHLPWHTERSIRIINII